MPNGCSPSAPDHAQPDAQAVLANGREMSSTSGKPQADPVAERWLEVWPVRRLAAARDALALCRKHAGESVIDEAIGHVAAMNPRPKSPRYLCVIVADWAQQRGAGLSAEALAELTA
jgi:hypothetical protein